MYFQANLHELHIYMGYLAGVRNFLARKFKKYEKRARRKRRDTDSQRSHSTIPSRFDAAGGCSRHVVSPTLCPFSTFRTTPALHSTHTYTYTYTNQQIPLSLSFLFPLCLSLIPYTPLPIRQSFTRQKEWFPLNQEPTTVPAALSTLVINTNCSIQTFKMCLTFLWHVIPSSSSSLF